MNKIKQLRIENKKTQAQMAAFLSITQAAYSKYECGRAEPTLETLIKLADFFGVTVDYLLGRTDDKLSAPQKEDENKNAALSSEELKLLEIYRKLSVKNRIHVTAYAQVRLEDQENGASSSWA